MKKVKSLILMLTFAFLLAGCGGNGSDASAPDNSAAGAAGDSQDSGSYPAQPIQIIVPLSPGGDTDLNARLVARYLEAELGQSVVIVNVDGAGGTIGMDQVKQAAPDGYNVLFFHTEAMLTEISGIIDYKLDEAYKMAGICIVDDTTVLATHKDSPFKTLEELEEYAKENPGVVEFGMQTGGYPNLIGLALEDKMGIDMNLVDVGGNAAKMTALLGHKTDLINIQYGLSKDHFANGEFINLGLCSLERNPLMPDIETTTEQGYEMNFNKFFFTAMPKDTPDEIVNTFSDALKKVCENPEFIAEAEKSFLTSSYFSPEDSVKYADDVYENLAQYKELFVGN